MSIIIPLTKMCLPAAVMNILTKMVNTGKLIWCTTWKNRPYLIVCSRTELGSGGLVAGGGGASRMGLGSVGLVGRGASRMELGSVGLWDRPYMIASRMELCSVGLRDRSSFIAGRMELDTVGHWDRPYLIASRMELGSVCMPLGIDLT